MERFSSNRFSDFKKARRKGVSLIELLITLVLISVAGLAILEVTRFSRLISLRSRCLLSAQSAAQSAMDQIRARAGNGTAPAASGTLSAPSDMPSGTTVQWTASIPTGKPDLYDVTVKVSWPNQSGVGNSSGEYETRTLIYIKGY